MEEFLVFRAHLGMTVLYILRYQLVGALARMEHYAATEIACQPGEMLHPSVESRLILHPRRHCHLYAPYRVERFLDAAHHNLTANLADESLRIGPPEGVAG